MKRPQVPNPRGQDAYSTIPALKQRKLKPIAVLGDVSPVEHGGGVLYEGPSGYEFHYFEAIDDEGDEVEISRTDIAPDVAADLIWVDDWEQIADAHGLDVEDFTKRLTSSDPRERATAYVEVANYHGWQNIDAYPLRESMSSVDKRYDKDINKAHAADRDRRGNPRGHTRKNPSGAVISTSETAQQVARRLARGETR